jgi:hypothetical protein
MLEVEVEQDMAQVQVKMLLLELVEQAAVLMGILAVLEMLLQQI